MKRILLLLLPFLIYSCSKSDGLAPSMDLVSLAITPTSLIVPKSISTNIQVIGVDAMSVSTDLTTKAACTSNNALVTINSSGQVSNTYTGASVQTATITCTYSGQTSSIPVTIVPATLQSLVLTKNSLSMAPGATQSIQVYGNFVDANSWVFALDMTNYVTWSSTAPAVSTANKGTVSGLAIGAATITASFASQTVNTGVSVASGALATSTPRGVGLTGSYYDFTTGPWTSTTIGDPFEHYFGSRIVLRFILIGARALII